MTHINLNAEVREILKDNPMLPARKVFEHLQAKYPGEPVCSEKSVSGACSRARRFLGTMKRPRLKDGPPVAILAKHLVDQCGGVEAAILAVKAAGEQQAG